jgi:hypothetical protein
MIHSFDKISSPAFYTNNSPVKENSAFLVSKSRVFGKFEPTNPGGVSIVREG